MFYMGTYLRLFDILGYQLGTLRCNERFDRLEDELCSKTNSQYGGYERDGDRQRHSDGAQRRGSANGGGRGSEY